MMYITEKCKELSCWIVFERKSGNLLWEVYRARLKKDCKKWIKENAKK